MKGTLHLEAFNDGNLKAVPAKIKGTLRLAGPFIVQDMHCIVLTP